jgi:hypothetical protein
MLPPVFETSMKKGDVALWHGDAASLKDAPGLVEAAETHCKTESVIQ